MGTSNLGSIAPLPADQQYIELNLSNYDLADVEQLNAWGIWAHGEIERLRAALELTIPVLEDDVGACSSCDYGHGSMGKGSEGDDCEDCAPQRGALAAVTAALSRETRLNDAP